ncbi:N-acetylmuramoyl-L-alanine amidase family protein [Candidatus Saccharibacteria bacterium]|nr:N-acetylmuramoyl-L-alanine amidase family protein [Candidatus Saccharibacteria bacterium]
MALQITRVNTPDNKVGVKCPYAMTPTRIVVHNTANKASAMNEISYMLNNANEVSFHFAVDYERAVQGIPLNRNAWHAGDGGSGVGNRQGIAIEICHSTGNVNDFIGSEQNGAILVAMLLKQYGWGIDKVTKHQDYSGKYCPHKTLDMGWARFLNMVQAELNALNGGAEEPSVGGLEPYNGFVTITYAGADGIDVHNTPTFDGDVACTVKKGEVFTVVGRIKVGGVYMYKIKSGLYITSAKEYVNFHTELHGGSSTPTPTPSAPKMREGATVKYKGYIYADSTGNGRGIAINGTYKVTIYNDNAYGAHLDGLGWVKPGDCTVIG